MSDNRIKKRVRDFKREYCVRELTLTAIKSIFEEQGFTLIYYNPIVNNDNVNIIVENLGLKDLIKSTNGFIYTDINHRLVFVNEKLSYSEKMVVLLHEEGHYYLGHTIQNAIVGQNVIEEYEANEFVHYLLTKKLFTKFKLYVMRYKIYFIVGLLAILCSIVAIRIVNYQHDQKLYKGTFYITMSGDKYHLKQCVTIQGHEIRRLTKEEFSSGDYTPCKICLPDRQ